MSLTIQDSREVRVDETDGDNVVQLTVVRLKGAHGRVVLRWMVSGDHSGLQDLSPVTGLVVNILFCL